MERSLQTDLSETEKREGLERVLSSSTFHRSDQLRSLLKYVCDCQIQGEGETLSEYTVAIGALGRPRDYSALEDGSVRNRIHTLRRRLEHYYEIENPGDLLRIEIPKGSYCPTFIKRPAVERVIPTCFRVSGFAPTDRERRRAVRFLALLNAGRA